MLSLDKRQMFPRSLFCMHFRKNDFTILFSHSILMADDGEDSSTTYMYIKRGKLPTLLAFTVAQFLAVTIPLQLPTQSVPCSYHSPAAPTLIECLAGTIHLQLPHSKSVLQLPFPCSSHTQTVPCSYHSPAAPTPRQCLAVTIPLQLPHS